MSSTIKNTPSEKGQLLLDTLQQAVTKTLEKKKRLGQYVVIWQNGKPVITGEDAPQSTTKNPTGTSFGK